MPQAKVPKADAETYARIANFDAQTALSLSSGAGVSMQGTVQLLGVHQPFTHQPSCCARPAAFILQQRAGRPLPSLALVWMSEPYVCKGMQREVRWQQVEGGSASDAEEAFGALAEDA